MGLTPHEYYCMTRAEFYLKAKGYNRKQVKEWEHTRLLAYTVASTVPSKKKLPKMTKWMPLSTDSETEIGKDRIQKMLEKVRNGGKQ